MSPPRRAILLAAGFGTRLRPLTHATPKALVPLWNRPNIDHCLDLLAGFGVREVLVNLHAGADAVFAHLREHPRSDLRIACSWEPEILGTGGALVRAAWFTSAAPFWILNADVAADVGPAAFQRALGRPRTLAALWMKHDTGPRTVELRDGRVRDFASATPGAAGTATFCGLHLVRPEILHFLPDEGFVSIIDAYRAAMRAGQQIAGVDPRDAYWADLGSAESYLAAHRDTASAARRRAPGAKLYDSTQPARAKALRARGIRIDDASAVPSSARLGAKSAVRNSVIFPHARLRAGARLSHTVVGSHASARSVSDGVVVQAATVPPGPIHDAIHALNWPTARVTAEALPARGSARSYCRLRHGPDSVLLMVYATERPENALFVEQCRFLARMDVPVPKVLHHSRMQQTVILEDLGHRDLLSTGAGGARRRRAYRAAIEACARMHTDGTRGLRRATRVRTAEPFSASLYRWEHELFLTHLVQPHLRPRTSAIRSIRAELGRLSRRLAREPKVLLHRDLQSTNVMLRKDGIALIDFQGMRLGPAVYDLASLLWDPYVELPTSERASLLAHYVECTDVSVDPHRLQDAVVQRLIQALGAYGRLGAMPRTRRFLQHVRPARARVRALLRQIPHTSVLQALFEEDWPDFGPEGTRA